MSRNWRDAVKRDQLPDTVRERFLELHREARERHEVLGNVAALRQASLDAKNGVIYKGEAQLLLDANKDLIVEARIARGWTTEKVYDTVFQIATNAEHKHWPAAAKMWTQAEGDPNWRQQSSRLELTGADGGPMVFEDRSASLHDVADVLTQVGALTTDSSGTPRAEVPAAGDILAAPFNG